MRFGQYEVDGFYDELFDESGQPRESAAPLIRMIDALPDGDLNRRQQAAEAALLQMGITYTVYGDDSGTERIFPFDIIPRIIEARDWAQIDAGLKQRITALNLFLDDIYHDQKIVRDGVVPEALIATGDGFRPQCVGLDPPNGVWCHITGTDLIRDADGAFYVLEDNLRCPSGVSYMLENRQVLKETFGGLFQTMRVEPVHGYPARLRQTLASLAPEAIVSPTIAVLTPGVYNSAYFEHSYLAQQMGVELVEGRDLVVVDGRVMMRTTRGFQRVDVIYRRIDDDFLDPETFNPDSMLGVPGLMDVYRAGGVALANAPGTGIADDKAVYAYVPRIIEYYLGEDALLPNVPTHLCSEAASKDHVLANLDKLVVKAVNQAGGYGMLIGPHSTQKQRDEMAAAIKAKPRSYIAQPTLNLSRAPVIVGERLEGRHVDLRPYVLYGDSVHVVPGGLTRVALKKGSLVVNSSQGGGSKDTWVLQDATASPMQWQINIQGAQRHA